MRFEISVLTLYPATNAHHQRCQYYFCLQDTNIVDDIALFNK